MDRNQLRLVECDPTYASAWHSWRQQPLALSFMPLKTDPIDVLAGRIRKSSSDLANRSAERYMWFIEAQGAIVGMIGLHSVDWKGGSAEITYIVDPNCHGRGIATLALTEMIVKTFQETTLNRLVAIVSRGNIASERLLAKLHFSGRGFLSEGYLIQGESIVQKSFELLRNEWSQNIH
jgi:RimJ/RimL family protein N-acetyltransferase